MTAKGPLRRVVGQSAIYGLANAVAKVAGLALAPFYLNPVFLTLESYGHLAIVLVTAQLGIAVVGLGIGPGLLRHMSDPRYEDSRAALPFTALVATAVAGCLAAALLMTVSEPLGGWLVGNNGSQIIVALLGTYVALKVVGSIPLTLLRIQERAGLYATAVSIEILALVVGVYYFLVHEHRGLEGVVLAYAVAAGFGTTILVVGTLARVQWKFRFSLIRPLIKFGLPLVLASLAGWFLNAGDRYLLNWLSDTESVGLYDWAARLGGVINMLFVQSFQLAFTVIGIKSLDAGVRSTHRRTFRHYVVWTGGGVLVLSLLTHDLMKVLVGWFDVASFYRGSDRLVLPIALGFMMYGLYVVVNNVLYAAGRTGHIGRNVLVAAVLNLLLNILLIPYLGAMGAAVTTAISYAVLVVLTAIPAEREVRIGYPWRSLVLVVALVGVLYGFGQATLEWHVALRLGARMILIASYVPLVFGLRVYTHEDWEAIRRHVRERLDAYRRTPSDPT